MPASTAAATLNATYNDLESVKALFAANKVTQGLMMGCRSLGLQLTELACVGWQRICLERHLCANLSLCRSLSVHCLLSALTHVN